MKNRCNFTRRLAPLLRFGAFSSIIVLAACSSETPPDSSAESGVAASAEAKLKNTTAVAGPSGPEVIELTDAQAQKAAENVNKQVNLTMAEGLDIQLWAPEKLLADPVAISVDNKGRIWAAVTNRSNNSEFDIRGYSQWEIPSIGFESTEDRREFLREQLAPEKSAQNDFIPDRNEDGSHDWRDLAVVAEEVVLLEDTSGNGRANRSQVFLRDFNSEVTDVLGGIYYHNQLDELFLAVAPHAWRVKDTDNDGIADTKKSLSDGFGVHIGFSGHGMSGVTLGPDGRIYYGIGDVGANITDLEGNEYYYPNQGVIVRSEPDGSNFEVFAQGVRNTHEFTFDKYGNLISVDNDGDHQGESERLVYLIDGSDSGWRITWQLGKYKDEKNNDYKVWMDEDYHIPHFEGQAAHLLPPIALYHNGPTGMVYNPGTALSEEWQEHFFVVEFVGSGARSGVNAFTLEPKGASFELATDRNVFRGFQATGLDVGPDGALYAADWIEGWGRNGEGRIWKLDTPATAGSAKRKETQQLLGADFAQRKPAELGALLHQADMRVRSKAQFELVERNALNELKAAAEQREHQLARIHGLWGIGQMARAEHQVSENLRPYLADEDAEIRAQAAKLLGDVRYAPATEGLLELLDDSSARVQFFAAEALGRIGAETAVEPLVSLLEANNDQDVYLRQVGAIALARIGDTEALGKLAEHPSKAVRLAAVVALRRLQSPLLTRFLEDKDAQIVTDAARGISDELFVEEALPALAKMVEQTRVVNEPLLRRAINANIYVGGKASAERLVDFAAKSEAPGVVRAEALETLAHWPESSVFDRVTGRHRGAVHNSKEDALAALTPVYEQLLSDQNELVRQASIAALGELGFTQALERLVQVQQNDASAKVRQTALEALQQLDYEDMGEAVLTALNDSAQSVRMTALGMMPKLDLPAQQIVDMHVLLLANGDVVEKQAAFASLANVEAPEAKDVLAQQMELLVAGQIDPGVQLELISTVESSGDSELLAQLEKYEASKDREDPLEVYQEALYGGDAQEGQNLFRYNSSAQCVRCHMVGKRGNQVGPNLTGIAHTLSREQMLEAMVAPAARIAPGFGRVTAVMADGRRIEGFFESETDATMTIVAGGGERHEVSKADVTKVETSASGMPPMGMLLNKAELRDLVAYMMTLTGEEAEDAETH